MHLSSLSFFLLKQTAYIINYTNVANVFFKKFLISFNDKVFISHYKKSLVTVDVWLLH